MDGNLSEIFITHVGEEGPLLKIWGQTDRKIPTDIERLIGQLTPQFNQGIGIPKPRQLAVGLLCCAQYTDGTYYRARVTSLDTLPMDQVGVQFADYGNLEVIAINNIRILEGFMTPLATCADQAVHFYLANVAPMTGEWTAESLKFVKDAACYMDLKFMSVGKVGNNHFIRIQLTNGMDLGDALAGRRISVNILLETQIGLLHSIENDLPLPPMQLWPRFNPEVPPPIPIAQMMVTQSTAQAVEKNILDHFASHLHPPPGMGTLPSAASTPLPKSPASRLLYQPRDMYGAPPTHTTTVVPIPTAGAPVVPYAAFNEPRRPMTASPPSYETAGFEVRRLNVNMAYPVRVVYVENGPESFIVFLRDMEEELSKMLTDINRQNPIPLSAPPMIGTICLGRSRDSSLLRAVVTQVSDTCKLYFVDFGTTEEVAFDDIYTIPSHYVANPKPMCVRFTHGGLASFEVTKEVKDVFASMVSGKCLTLYVTAPEVHHLKQFGILFDDGKSVLNGVKTLIDARKNSTYQRVAPLNVGSTKSVTVAYIESTAKFFVLLEDDAASLESLMAELAAHCLSDDPANLIATADVREGLLCCAQFADDEQWYRAQVIGVSARGVHVHYVDYGNREVVDVGALRAIPPELVAKLKAQAVECCLSGYEGAGGDDRVETRFSELVVDKSLIAFVVSHTAAGVPAVNLHDLAATPLLSVGVELDKLKDPAGVAVVAPAAKIVYHQPDKPFRNADDSKHRSGSRFYDGNQRNGNLPWRGRCCEETDWRSRGADNRRPAQPPRGGGGDNNHNGGGGAWEEPRSGSRNDGRVDTWEGSREGRAAADAAFPPPAVKSGDVSAAQLVFTENPEDFYVQTTPDTALVDLMADIAVRYGGGGGRPLAQVSRGVPCVARYSEDNEWYRGVVQSADSRVARVAFVDFGNVDDVPLESVKEIAPAFVRFPAQAVRCCLSGSLPKGAEWSAEEIAEFAELTDGRPLEVRFGTERGGVFSVTVTDAETGAKINDRFCVVDKPPPPQQQQQQQGGDRKHDRPAQSYDKPAPPQHEKLASSYDRGGRSDYERPTKTRESNESARSPPAPAAVAVVERPPRKEPRPPPQEFARPDERLQSQALSADQSEEVGVTWFISPEEFYVSLGSSAAAFDRVMRDLQPACRAVRPIGDALDVGAPAVGVFKEDKSFCRVEVDAAPNPYSYVVRFVDYGNCELVSKKDLYPIESRFLRLPKNAVLCSLRDVKPPALAWPAVSDEIDAHFRGDKYRCTFHEEVEGKYLVSLERDGTDVGAALVEKGLACRPPAPEDLAPPPVAEEPVAPALLVGQTLRANVTYVEGVSKFFVHLANNRAAEIQAAVDAFAADDANKVAFPATEVSAGNMCLASSDGKQWYRGVMVDCTGTSGIFVTFLDYGDGDEVTADKMMPIPEALAAAGAQAMECVLAGAADADLPPDVEDAFKEALEGEDVILRVVGISDGRLEVIVYTLDGAKLPMVSTVGGGPAVVPAVCPSPVLTQKAAVFVSHADDPASVWLQRADDADKIAELLETMYAVYEEEKAGVLAAAAPGLVCAARSVADEQWYRAVVLDAEADVATVRFIDYGNIEQVSPAHVQELDARFVAQHELALRVALPVSPVAGKNVDLVAMTAEVQYVAAFARSADGDAWIAELFHEKSTFSDALVELGFALVDAYPFAEVKEELTSSARLVLGEPAAVFVSHVGSPTEVWVQFACNVSEIERTQELLQAAAPELEDLTVPVIDRICAAVFSEDGFWYRAVVLKVNESAVTVRFVDYGNTDVVDILTTPLKQLTKRLATAEWLAVRCALNVSPIDREFSAEATQRINDLVVAAGTEPLTATMIKEGNVVDLDVGGRSVFDVLTDEALAIEHYDPDTVFVSHLASPAEFYIQYQSATYQLEAMTERMTESADFDPLPDGAGDDALCAALFADDGAWYRARVESRGADGAPARVRFVDFGNAAAAGALRALPEDLTVTPPVAKRCALRGAERLGAAAAAAFAEMTAEASFVVRVVEYGDPVVVDLLWDGRDVGEMLAKVAGVGSEPAAATGRVVGVGEVLEDDEKVVLEVEEKELEVEKEELEVDEKELEVEKEELEVDEKELEVEKEELEVDEMEQEVEKEELEVDEKEQEVEKEELEVDEKEREVEKEELEVEEKELEVEKEELEVDEKELEVEKELEAEKKVLEVVEDLEVEQDVVEVVENVLQFENKEPEVHDEATAVPEAASVEDIEEIMAKDGAGIPAEDADVFYEAEAEPTAAAIPKEKPEEGSETVVDAVSPRKEELRFVEPPKMLGNMLVAVPEDAEPCDPPSPAKANPDLLETVVEEDAAPDDSLPAAKHEDEIAVAEPAGRPSTPHDLQIVPGAVCRGLSEEELAESVPSEEELRREAEARHAPSPAPSPRVVEERVTRSCPPSPPRAATPVRLAHGERIVPGCVSGAASTEDLSALHAVDPGGQAVKGKPPGVEAAEVNGVDGKC